VLAGNLRLIEERKKEEGRRKKEEGRRKAQSSAHVSAIKNVLIVLAVALL